MMSNDNRVTKKHFVADFDRFCRVADNPVRKAHHLPTTDWQGIERKPTKYCRQNRGKRRVRGANLKYLIGQLVQ